MGIVLTTHLMDDAQRLADYVYIIDAGGMWPRAPLPSSSSTRPTGPERPYPDPAFRGAARAGLHGCPARRGGDQGDAGRQLFGHRRAHSRRPCRADGLVGGPRRDARVHEHGGPNPRRRIPRHFRKGSPMTTVTGSAPAPRSAGSCCRAGTRPWPWSATANSWSSRGPAADGPGRADRDALLDGWAQPDQRRRPRHPGAVRHVHRIHGQGIATGFDRRYGVMRFLSTTPLGRTGLIAGKIMAVLAVLSLQVLVIAGTALMLGWRPTRAAGCPGLGCWSSVPPLSRPSACWSPERSGPRPRWPSPTCVDPLRRGWRHCLPAPGCPASRRMPSTCCPPGPGQWLVTPFSGAATVPGS